MSCKNLSRTVIEGGRGYYNRWDRRQSSVDERASTREWLGRVAIDDDLANELVVPPRRRVGKDFRDKLGPAKRWLAAQVGRPWNKVYAELRAKFDARTVAGKHVVDDHMLPWVYRGDLARAWWRDRDFIVDAHGILRRGAFYGASWSRLRKQAAAFAQGRRAAHTDKAWWWARIVGADACFDPRCAAQHEVVAGQRGHPRLVLDRAMTRSEVRQLDRLLPEHRNQIVVCAP